MTELAGVFAATVTPFVPGSLVVDHSWIQQHMALLRDLGCDGVVPLGTNGEGPSLSVAERLAVIETVMSTARGMAVVPGTGCASLTDTVWLTRATFAAGADAVLVIPPFYYKDVSPQGVLAYYRRLCDQALEPGQQVLLYHFPRMSAVPITPTVVDGLQDSHPGCVAGFKDSSGDLNSIRGWLERYPGLLVFGGSDTLAAEAYAAGCAGTISASANVAPDLIQSVRSAVRAGDDPSESQARLSAIRGLLGRFPMRASTKYLLSLWYGLPPAAVRPPLVELSEEQRGALRGESQSIGVSEGQSLRGPDAPGLRDSDTLTL